VYAFTLTHSLIHITISFSGNVRKRLDSLRFNGSSVWIPSSSSVDLIEIHETLDFDSPDPDPDNWCRVDVLLLVVNDGDGDDIMPL